MRAILCTAIVVLCAASSGATGSKAVDARVADLLWLPPSTVIRAAAPRQTHLDGSADVAFDIPDVNRTALAAAFRAHFRAAGWRERDEVTVNECCGTRTSFKEGWHHECQCVALPPDEFPNRPKDVSTWHGEWQDSHGNRIGYSLIASDARVSGYAAYSPKVMALAQERQQRAAQAEERRRETAAKATAR